MLKIKISAYLQRLLEELGETQEGLAERLGIPKSSLQGYLKGKNLPGIDVLIRMAEIGGITMDELIKSGDPKINIEIKNSKNVIMAGRDVYQNTTIRRKTEYRPGPDDITGEQANTLKNLVNDIVVIEQKVKKKPKTHGAIWNALNRKMGVTYYREIKQDRFEEARSYLRIWIGRITRGLERSDNEQWRDRKYKSIYAMATKELGWKKEDVHNYTYGKYQKEGLSNLTDKELNALYNVIRYMKKKIQEQDREIT
jgi:transcriptional regulator with XRE-family HTH domain